MSSHIEGYCINIAIFALRRRKLFSFFFKNLDSSKSLVAIWLFRTANSADDPLIDAMGRFITLFALATVVVGFLIRPGG